MVTDDSIEQTIRPASLCMRPGLRDQYHCDGFIRVTSNPAPWHLMGTNKSNEKLIKLQLCFVARWHKSWNMRYTSYLILNSVGTDISHRDSSCLPADHRYRLCQIITCLQYSSCWPDLKLILTHAIQTESQGKVSIWISLWFAGL